MAAVVDAEQLRHFAAAIGDGNPERAGSDSKDRLLVPPTYLFCLEMQSAEQPFAFVEELGLKITEILHASQSFTYHRPVHSGERLTFRGRVADVVEKRGGALTFVVQAIAVEDERGACVADLERTLVVRAKDPAE